MKFPHNISRIEAFSDAVFAFAATLLVVSLGTDNSDSIIEVDIKSFVGFAISFFVLVAVLSIIIAYLQIGINYGLPGILYSLLGPFCSIHSYLFYKKYKIN